MTENPSTSPLAIRDYWRDDVLVRTAAQKGTVFEIDLAPVIALPTERRAQAFRELRIFLGKCAKFGAKVKITFGGGIPPDSKSQRELQAIATEILGMDEHRAKAAVSPSG